MSNQSSNSTQTKSPRFREFDIVTYLSVKQVEEVLKKHINKIRAYAYGLHDKDEGKENHVHIVFKLYNATTVSAVLKWFRGYYDSKYLKINTFVQKAIDTHDAVCYIAHEDRHGNPIPNKYHYGKEIIISYNIDILIDSNKDDEDSITCALSEILEGVPLKQVALKYGRDFIIHYHSIKRLIDDINLEENKYEGKNNW